MDGPQGHSGYLVSNGCDSKITFDELERTWEEAVVVACFKVTIPAFGCRD
jgi:hypothetical protein